MVPHRPTPGNRALQHSVTARDGADAQACAEVADALANLLQQDVATWTQRGFEQVKLRTVRRVLRGRLGDEQVFVKVFRADTIAARTRAALRVGKGEREARHLQAAAELGLPAVEPLAFGHALDDGERCSFLVTRAVAGRAFSFPAPAADAAAAGALLRRVHDLGVMPGDLHPGNLLVAERGDGVWLCDPSSLRRVGEPSLRRRAHGLAFFCNGLDGGPLDPAARPLLRAYRDAGAPLPDALLVELAGRARQLRATALRSFGRRALRACRDTEAEPRRRGHARWFWHLHGDTGSRREQCRAFDPEHATPRRSGRRGAVFVTDTLVVKQRDAGKARRLWTACYLLTYAGVPIAPPVALRLHLGSGLVFHRRLPHDDLRTELAAGTLDAATVAALARRLGRAVGRLHGHGLRNRDLKFENLVRTPDGELAMVDLDGVTLGSADDTRGCGRDLGRLLAAFRVAGTPGGDDSVRRFVRGYVRARRRLLQSPPIARILRRAEERAGEWRSAHAGKP